jgi:hypothetical protein
LLPDETYKIPDCYHEQEPLDPEHQINSMPAIVSNSADVENGAAKEIAQLCICVGLTQRETVDGD